MTDLFPDVRSALASAAKTDARRRRRRRRRPVAAVAAVAAVAGALAVGWPSEKADVVARAQAALSATPNEIVHTILTQTMRTPQTPAGKARTETIEQWEASNPTRGRIWFRPSQAPVGGVQRAYDSKYYDPLADSSGSSPRSGSLDPVVEIKRLLNEGLLRDAGQATVDGRAVRRLHGQVEDLGSVQDITYDVDPDSYEPFTAQARLTPRVEGVPRVNDTLTVTTRFELIERLPLTPENEQLLQVQPMPDSANTDPSATRDPATP